MRRLGAKVERYRTCMRVVRSSSGSIPKAPLPGEPAALPAARAYSNGWRKTVFSFSGAVRSGSLR
jgi:hypothetical protein